MVLRKRFVDSNLDVYMRVLELSSVVSLGGNHASVRIEEAGTVISQIEAPLHLRLDHLDMVFESLLIIEEECRSKVKVEVVV